MSHALKAHQREKQQVVMAIAYVFREEPATLVAEHHDVSPQTVRRHLRDFGVRIRSTSEQRHCDRRHGRFCQSAAIKSAWSRGAFATEAYRSSLRTRNQYDRRGELNPFFGRSHSAATRQVIREKALDRTIPGIGEYTEDWTAALRAEVIDRDGSQCQVCGVTEGKLQVHHLDLDRTNNDETNLLTVCASCHLAYHGRAELQDEMRTAHAELLTRLRSASEAPP